VILSEHQIETSAQNQFPGRVRSVEQVGHLIKVELDCGILLRSSITEYSRDHFRVEPGRELIATFKASAVRLY
jgi:molybdopterin-binding protein